MKDLKVLEAKANIRKHNEIIFTKGRKYYLFVAYTTAGSILAVKDNFDQVIHLSENDISKYFNC